MSVKKLLKDVRERLIEKAERLRLDIEITKNLFVERSQKIDQLNLSHMDPEERLDFKEDVEELNSTLEELITANKDFVRCSREVFWKLDLINNQFHF